MFSLVKFDNDELYITPSKKIIYTKDRETLVNYKGSRYVAKIVKKSDSVKKLQIIQNNKQCGKKYQNVPERKKKLTPREINATESIQIAEVDSNKCTRSSDIFNSMVDDTLCNLQQDLSFDENAIFDTMTVLNDLDVLDIHIPTPVYELKSDDELNLTAIEDYDLINAEQSSWQQIRSTKNNVLILDANKTVNNHTTTITMENEPDHERPNLPHINHDSQRNAELSDGHQIRITESNILDANQSATNHSYTTMKLEPNHEHLHSNNNEDDTLKKAEQAGRYHISVSNTSTDDVNICSNRITNESDLTYIPNENSLLSINVSKISNQSLCDVLEGGPPINIREIIVPTSKNLNKRTSKKNFCPYCKKLQSKFARHLQIVHKTEKEVQSFLKLPKRNIERCKIIETIRKHGNYIHNTKPDLNTGILITCRQRQKNNSNSSEDYICCQICKGFFSKRTLRIHSRKCNINHKKGSKQLMIMGRRLQGYIHPRANVTLRRKVFPVLRDDEITRVIKYDLLIILFGNKLCEKYTLDHQHDMIRSNLRLLGRFLMAVKIKDDQITSLSDVFQPQYFDSTFEAIKECAGFDLDMRMFKAPSVATSLGTLLKKCLRIWKSECIKCQNEEKKKSAEDFMTLFEEEVPTSINRKVLEDQLKKKRDQKVILPTKGDIFCLNTYLKTKCLSALESLEKGFSLESYSDLSECSLVLLMCFNRRRAGEIERLLISDFKNQERIDKNANADVYNKLSEESRCYAKKFVRITIRGKLGRVVPVLLDSFIINCIETILKYRRDAQISSRNEYVFAVPEKSGLKKSYIRACPLMRKFSENCGAKMPTTLRGTTLRKHIATHTAMIGIEEREVSELANFMGHHKDVHKSVYRVPIPVRDLTHVSRILEEAMGGEDSSDDNNNNENNPPCQINNSISQYTPARPPEIINFNAGDEDGHRSTDDIYKNSDHVPTPKVILRRRHLKISSDEDSESCTPHQSSASQCFPARPSEIIDDNAGEHDDSHRSTDDFDKNANHIPTPKVIRRRQLFTISSDEESENCTPRRSTSPFGKTKRVRWNTAEKEAIQQCFGDPSKIIKLPSLIQCSEAIKGYKSLARRTPQQVKTWIDNQRKAESRVFAYKSRKF